MWKLINTESRKSRGALKLAESYWIHCKHLRRWLQAPHVLVYEFSLILRPKNKI